MATTTFPINGILDQTPDPFQKQYKVQIGRNNSKGRVEIKTSRNTGGSYQVLLPEVTDKVKIGSVPTVQSNRDVEWSVPAVPPPTFTGIYVEMAHPSTLALNDVFGYYVAPNFAVKCTGIQFYVATPATGSSIKVDFIQVGGSVSNKVSTIPAVVNYSNSLLSVPLTMTANSRWQLKLIQVGSTAPGEFLYARLLISPA